MCIVVSTYVICTMCLAFIIHIHVYMYTHDSPHKKRCRDACHLLRCAHKNMTRLVDHLLQRVLKTKTKLIKHVLQCVAQTMTMLVECCCTVYVKETRTF